MRASLPAGLVLLVSLSLLGACGDDGPPDGRSGSAASGSPATTAVPEVLVSCHSGQNGWKASAMEGGITSEVSREQLVAALAVLKAEARVDAPAVLQETNVEDASWFVLAESGSEITLAAGAWDRTGPGKDGQYILLEKEGRTWTAKGWGDCRRLAPVLEGGAQWVQVDVGPAFDRTSARPTVVLQEQDCTSSRDPRPYLDEPTVLETEASVTISWTSRAPGAATCPGNPSVEQPVELKEPLGDRALLDGSTYPPRQVAAAR